MKPIPELRMIATIPVTLIRKKIKHLYISVKPPDGTVIVSVPEYITDAQITELILSKQTWILQKQKEMQQQKLQPKREDEKTCYHAGEKILLWGKSYCFSAPVTQPQEWYRTQLKAKIAELLPDWEAKTGLYCSSWHVKAMKTRWGSCNVTAKRIWLNLFLIHYPPECLEYVLLHELAHLKIQNHGKAFYDFLDQYMPDWKERQQLLRTNGQTSETT